MDGVMAANRMCICPRGRSVTRTPAPTLTTMTADVVMAIGTTITASPSTAFPSNVAATTTRPDCRAPRPPPITTTMPSTSPRGA